MVLQSRAVKLLIATFCIVAFAADDEKPFQIKADTYDKFIASLPEDQGVLMEYYAHWCPACQAFQPNYEKVAQYFNAEPKVKPEVVVARIDCADEGSLCGKAGIGKYPTLKYGLPTAFTDENKDQLQEYEGHRGVDEIIEWIGHQKGVLYNFNASQASAAVQEVRDSKTVALVGTEVGTPLTIVKEADAHDLEKATTLAFKYALESTQNLKGLESRQAFRDFLDVISVAHPIQRCQVGAKKMQKSFARAWPADRLDGPDDSLQQIHICGADAEQKDWRMCKGSKENKRGYTCGLWTLFHSLAGKVQPDDTGGLLWMTAIRGYVQHFFGCSDCAKHFGEMASEPAAQSVASRKDAVLWVWRAHNEVNRRLEAEERLSGDGDPAFPKQQWPPTELCPLCRLPSLSKTADVTWNQDEVYRFLLTYYHGIPEPQWVTQRLRAGTKLLGLSGRKTMPGSTVSAAHHSGISKWLLIILIACLAAVAYRSRAQTRTRKVVSL